MHSILSWAAAHDTVIWLIVTPILTSLITIAAKPRTPEQYDAIAARYGRVTVELLRLVAAIGPDPVKVVKIIRRIVSPPGPGSIVGLMLVGSVVLGTSGCTLQKQTALAEILARKVACALAHQGEPDARILAVCAIDPADAPNILTLVSQERAARMHERDEGFRAAAASCRSSIEDRK